MFFIIYCTLAFGLHGGELATGINRQVRNLLCAVPFALVGLHNSWLLAVCSGALAYVGANLGFDWFPSSGWKYYAGLAFKGFITFIPFGAIILPFAYWIGDKTKWKNVFSEYFSGFLYGLTLSAIQTLR